ncbi:hypothetical protein I4U23_023623 [Adineta vaga]|nr:hypothetical protein I4U23_023623 [Adineta vaga]
MDYFIRKQRQRLIEDLLELQREEDLHRLYQSITYNTNNFEQQQIDSDSDDYERYHYRRKEYCLISVIYRDSHSQRKKSMDEIIITQHNRIVYKGCLKHGDQFTFKSKRYRNESHIRLKFYINDVLEDEMTSCCEHGLINRNRRKHLFRIERIIGSKPCYECRLDYDSTSSGSHSLTSSFSKYNSCPACHRSSSTLSEDQSDASKSKKKQSRLTLPKLSNRKASSEGFIANINDIVENDTYLRKKEQKSDEDLTDTSTVESPSPSKRTYGPPQLSMMSASDAHDDSPVPSVHEQPFNSSQTNEQNSVSQSNSRRTIQRLESIPSRAESNADEQTVSLSLNHSNEIAIANDATQLLLARLGILRQQQVERPEVSTNVTIREKGNVEYFTLVYLHSTYPDDGTIRRLRSLVNFLKIFNDIDDCVAFINSIVFEKIILILSNMFCESILSRIEELQQIYTIYVLHDTEGVIDFSSTQSKIQGFYTNINDIYNEMTINMNKISRDLITYFNASSNAVTLDSMFVYYHLLIEIILDKNETSNGFKELIDFAREEYEGNEIELTIIDEFENAYQSNKAIYWFTRKCFLSKMINKALRIPEADVLYKLRVFIQDLYEQLIEEATNSSLTVYFAQTIQRSDLDDLHKNILSSNLIILPQFLFGSTDRTRAIRIAHDIPRLTADFVPLIICINIPDGFKCANLHSHRYEIDEDNDVLLNMNTMGRLTQIDKEHTNEDHIAYIYVTVVKCEHQQQVQQILDVKRTEMKSFSPFATLIKLMIAMNQQTSAENFTVSMYKNPFLRDNTNIQSSIAACLHVLATNYRNQEDFHRAVHLYLLSLQAFLRVIPPNALELSTLYINIATMYFRIDNYEKALDYYQKGLDIHLHSNSPDLYSISNCTNSIGIVYLKQERYEDAIKSFERTLKILHQIPDSHESELALTYDNIGDAYLAYGKYDEALNHYTKSLNIQEQISPKNPQTLGTSYHTIGNIYLKLGRCRDALVHLKRALEYQQQYLPLVHPAFALLYNNIGLMHYRIEQYNEALQCYHKSLEIAAIALPDNHSMVGITLFNMGLVYSSEDKYDEAMESIEKSTIQFLKTLPPDHPDVLENQSYMESIRQKKMLKDLFEEHTTTF